MGGAKLKSKRKTGGRRRPTKPLKPGNKLAQGNKNRKGKPALQAETRAVAALDKVMLTNYLVQHTHLTPDELRAKVSNKTTPWIEVAISQIMLRTQATGDIHGFNALMDRIDSVGPISRKLEIDRTNRWASMNDKELLEEKRRLAAIAEIRLRQIENAPQIYEKLLAEHAKNMIDVTPKPAQQEVSPESAPPTPGDVRAIASGE